MVFGLDAKGAVNPNELEEAFSKFNKLLNLNEEEAIKIGHMIGDPEHYPKSIKTIQKGTAHDLCDLMSKSFDKYKFNGIELDVQLYPNDGGKNQDVVVTHDVLKASNIDKTVKNYFEKNNFKSILYDFIEKGYFREKYMFIELKEESGMNEEYKKELRERVAQILEDIISEYKFSDEDKSLFKSHIGFISFGLDNLKNMQELIKEKDSYTHHFIASTDKFIGHFLRKIPAFSYIRCIDDEFIEKLKSSSRLNSVRLDPIGIKNVGKFIKKFDNRENADPMKFHISTYKLAQQDFMKKILKEDIPNENIGGLIFDVKE